MFLLAFFSIFRAEGATFYVDANGTNPVAPYDDWSTAATNIQDAIDASSDGDLIEVTNGVYAAGGRTVIGSTLTNRVVIDKAVAVQSMNGAQMTTIQGYQISGTTNGTEAVRCVYLTNGASLTGFTITGGATLPGGNDVQDGGDTSGGGILCVAGATVSNCVFVSNAAGDFGGGAYGGTFYNCLFYDNWATLGVGSYGGGDFGGTLYNCTEAYNSADNGSGDAFGSLNNCIVYDNDAAGANYDFSSMNYSCTTPDPGGVGDVTNDPAFIYPQGGNFHLRISSPCIDTGDNTQAAGSTDLDGNPRIVGSAVDMGAYEFHGGTHYVNINNPTPVAPYADWTTAATNIQDAIDASSDGDLIMVTNGIYQSAGETVEGFGVTNAVAIDKSVSVQSVNGPAVTAIEGFTAADTTGMRCVYMTNGTMLAGFTLTNGATIQGGDYAHEWSGAGIWCESSSVVVSNCVFINNTAQGDGGGIYGGTAIDCTFTNNYGWEGGAASTDEMIDCLMVDNRGYYGAGAYNSSLTQCTLTGNFTYIDDDYTANGGAASACWLTNCVITGNSSLTGGGASACTLVNCLLANNRAEGAGSWPPNGGGAYGSTLINCTVVYNSAVTTGGGVNSCTATNCIIYFNTAPNGTNYSDDSSLSYCDTTLPATNGVGNITGDPLLADEEHINGSSPCIGAGTPDVTSGVDIDGEAWMNPPSIGCDEYNADSATGALSAAITATFTNVAAGFTVNFTAQISGHALANRWSFDDGTVESNLLADSHTWSAPGSYTVTYTVYNTSYPGGTFAVPITISVLQNPVHHVMLGNTTPAAPYLTWATAATNIQDAVDAAYAGGTVMVSNGVYQTGVRVMYGFRTNRVAVAKPISLQSVNGAGATVIDGGGAVRCLYLTNHVLVTGFTMQNGNENTGAGVFCEDMDDILSYCVMSNNMSPEDWSTGGGDNGGTLSHCLLVANYASYLGGGADGATMSFCVFSNNARPAYGGAAAFCVLDDCLVESNQAAWGGGVEACTLSNCLCINNWANYAGGGAVWSTLYNCTVVSNTVPTDPGTFGGGGVYDGPIYNSIVYDNNGGNYGTDFGITLSYCCTTPDPGGIGNITNDPVFVNPDDGDYHLQSNSPCINAGDNYYVSATNDLDNNPRISGGTVDMGAYEFQNPSSILSYAWAQQYGLPTDGSADYSDMDGTGMPNWEKAIAGLNPTNSASVLMMSPPTPMNDGSGTTLTWQSVTAVAYYVQRSSDLTQPFVTIQDNIMGQAGTTSFLDMTATNAGPYFYRVGVQ